MEYRASHRYASMSPTKVRLVADTIRSMDVNDALNQLRVMNKRSARLIEKVLRSAIANAEMKNVDADKLSIKKIYVDAGPIRYWRMYRARYRMNRIRHRTCHINVVLNEV